MSDNKKRENLLSEASEILSGAKETVDTLVEQYRERLTSRKEFKSEEALEKISDMTDKLIQAAEKIKQAKEIRHQQEKQNQSPESSSGQSANNNTSQSESEEKLKDEFDELEEARKKLEQALEEEQEQQEQDQKNQDSSDNEDKQKGSQEKNKNQKKEQKQEQQKNKEKGQNQQDNDADFDEEGEDSDMEGEGQSSDKNGSPRNQNKKPPNKQKEKQKNQKNKGQDSSNEQGDDEQEGQEDSGNGSNGQESEKTDESKDKSNGKSGKEKTVDVDDVGDMPDIDEPGETPEEQSAKEAGQDGEGQASQDSDGEDEGQTADELMDDIAEAEAQEAQNKQEKEGKENQKENDGGNKGGKSNLSKLPIIRDSWLDYLKNKTILAPYIHLVARALQKVQEKQVEQEKRLSSPLALSPKNKLLKRFNVKAHKNLVIKKMTGQKIDKKDFQRFHQDEKYDVPTTVDLFLLIDGSSSMTSGGPVTYMDSALTGAAIIREAARKLGNFNVYIGIWGSKNVHWIGMPNMSDQQIGAGFESARKGLKCGTELNPAIIDTMRVGSEDRTKKGKLSGCSHIIVISDGDVEIGDKPKMTRSIETLLSESPETTVDFVIVKTNTYNNMPTEMEKAAKTIVFKRKQQEVSITKSSDPKTFSLEIIKLLFKKVNKAKSFIAVSNNKKRNRYRNAYNRTRHTK